MRKFPCMQEEDAEFQIQHKYLPLTLTEHSEPLSPGRVSGNVLSGPSSRLRIMILDWEAVTLHHLIHDQKWSSSPICSRLPKTRNSAKGDETVIVTGLCAVYMFLYV